MLRAIEKVKAEFKELTDLSGTLLEKATEIVGNSSDRSNIEFDYQVWYTKCLPAVKALAADRYDEFVEQYTPKKSVGRKNIDPSNYTISDFLSGLVVTRGALQDEVFSSKSVLVTRLMRQITILHSIAARLESVLVSILQLVQADLFDSEISAAEELRKKGHLRAAGVLAGVTLEHHLKSVCSSHRIRLAKAKSTISHYNDALREGNVYDVPDWRRIQHLGDVRNLCGHSRGREPTNEDIEDMLRGVRRVIKEIS